MGPPACPRGFITAGEDRWAWERFERSCRCTEPDDPYQLDGLCYRGVSTKVSDYFTQRRIDNLIAILQDLARVYVRARWETERKTIEKVIKTIRFDGEVPRYIGCWDGRLLVALLSPLTDLYDVACRAAQEKHNCPTRNAPVDDIVWQSHLAMREKLHIELEARHKLIDWYVEKAGLEKYRIGAVLDFNNQPSQEEFKAYRVINERIHALRMSIQN